MEFVTSSTNDNCVKYFWARVKFSRIIANKYPTCEICWNQARVFTKQLEWVCIWVDNCTKTDNLFKIDELTINILHSQCLAENVPMSAFFSGKTKRFWCKRFDKDHVCRLILFFFVQRYNFGEVIVNEGLDFLPTLIFRIRQQKIPLYGRTFPCQQGWPWLTFLVLWGQAG